MHSLRLLRLVIVVEARPTQGPVQLPCLPHKTISLAVPLAGVPEPVGAPTEEAMPAQRQIQLGCELPRPRAAEPVPPATEVRACPVEIDPIADRLRVIGAKHPEPEGCNFVTVTDTDEPSFTFLLCGTAEAHAIGSWAKSAFLPPEMFHALLQSLIGEWLEAGSDASATAAAEVVALVAYCDKETSAR